MVLAQMVEATVAWSLLAGNWNFRVFWNFGDEKSRVVKIAAVMMHATFAAPSVRVNTEKSTRLVARPASL